MLINEMKGIEVIQANFVEYRKTIAGATITLKDYSFTIKNNSDKPIDLIAIAFKGEKQERVNSRSYKYSLLPLQPQALYVRDVAAVDPTLTPYVKLVIYADNTFEGDAVLAKQFLGNWELGKTHVARYIARLEALRPLGDQEITAALKALKAEVEDDIHKAKEQGQSAMRGASTPQEAEASKTAGKIFLGELVQHTQIRATDRVETILFSLRKVVARVDGKLQ